MIAAHSPMTRLKTGGGRNDTVAAHFTDYTTLFAKYDKVHIWSGHTHETFNHCYSSSHALASIEEHTVVRATGELWTNEYLSGGTPRGYVVVEVDGNNVSWKFKPTIYQSGVYSEKGYTEVQPAYEHRDWDYNSNGVAKMRSNGATLSESYQMKVYAPGTYNDSFDAMVAGDTKNNYIYVNIFLWDSKWELPKFNGVEMEYLKYKDDDFPLLKPYSLAEYEIRQHYTTYGPLASRPDEYAYSFTRNDYIHTMFRIEAPSASGTGTVTVTDRFGNNYSSSISW